jgi:hypothetical protein
MRFGVANREAPLRRSFALPAPGEQRIGVSAYGRVGKGTLDNLPLTTDHRQLFLQRLNADGAAQLVRVVGGANPLEGLLSLL